MAHNAHTLLPAGSCRRVTGGFFGGRLPSAHLAGAWASCFLAPGLRALHSQSYRAHGSRLDCELRDGFPLLPHSYRRQLHDNQPWKGQQITSAWPPLGPQGRGLPEAQNDSDVRLCATRHKSQSAVSGKRRVTQAQSPGHHPAHLPGRSRQRRAGCRPDAAAPRAQRRSQPAAHPGWPPGRGSLGSAALTEAAAARRRSEAPPPRLQAGAGATTLVRRPSAGGKGRTRAACQRGSATPSTVAERISVNTLMLASKTVVAARPVAPSATTQAKLGVATAPLRAGFAPRRADIRRCVLQGAQKAELVASGRGGYSSRAQADSSRFLTQSALFPATAQCVLRRPTLAALCHGS